MIAGMHAAALKEKRILLTRAREHLSGLHQLVKARGAEPVDFPCLEVEFLSDAVASGLTLLDECSDVLFTSINGVNAVESTLSARGDSLASTLREKRIAAVGEKTAALLRERGVRVDIVPDESSQDGLIHAYQAHGLPASLLFFRAQQGREALARAMLKQGVRTVTVPAYRTVCPGDDASRVIAMLEGDSIDAVLLGSAKTAGFYINRIGSLKLANRPVIAVISEKLAAAARELGLNVQVVAKHASFDAMLDALVEHFESNPC